MFTLGDIETSQLLKILKRDPDAGDMTLAFQHTHSEWLLYDGQHINLYSGSYGQKGALLASYKATSGLPGHQVARESTMKDQGPLPEGKYWILLLPNPNRIAKADPRTGEILANPKGGIERLPKMFTTTTGQTLIYPGWGNTRARLFPDKSTRTHGRNNFYLHDSHKGYSHGCIETEPTLFDKLLQIRKGFTKIALMVDYPSDSTTTNGGTQW
ncbi:tlde1 domain-containing protein [Chitinophaga sp. 22321]|uniref:DUF2778 domain-containing protein n=1 Tax=Chitinophaga hostae TaxID=2831022 RepID=A0ABS5JCE1_9BACT|nr:tlde1 domain-containing protein [Chitinophaga hostae]MBS0032142.1 DUF2778 domain-containing protein [Chitinophaga hostae]